jgi:hypothetical protein
MKLNIVPARTGLTWVKLGITTFIKQPLAMSGLFFMFMALLSVATMVPFVGAALALALLPAATLGLMAATKEAAKGNFPMPSILISAFRAGQQQMRAMLVLGALYALGFLMLMGVSALFEELVLQEGFQTAMWVAMGLYLPLSLLFWHAPALVHWHGVSPVKSLFFSFMACYKNFGALTVFGLAWTGVFVLAAIVVALIASLLGNPMLANAAMFPVALVIVAMFFTSIYFTFRDSFEATPEDAPDSIDDAS